MFKRPRRETTPPQIFFIIIPRYSHAIALKTHAMNLDFTLNDQQLMVGTRQPSFDKHANRTSKRLWKYGNESKNMLRNLSLYKTKIWSIIEENLVNFRQQIF